MPENNSPASKPELSVEPGELAFDTPLTENPRLKRRSLKPRPIAPLRPAGEVPSSAQDRVQEAPPRSAEQAVSEAMPEHLDDDDKNAAVKFTEAEPIRPQPVTLPAKSSQPYVTRPTPGATPSTSPSRPATLYYSTGQRKEQVEPSSMKSSIPTAGMTSPQAPRTTTSSIRPASVVDYRTNVERQSREQHSIGGLLTIIVYVLIGFFVLTSSLAGYGIYALSKQIQKQSLTMGELDRHYAAENQALTNQLKSTMDTLAQAQAQIGRQQELILRQQDAINKLMVANDAVAASLRQERSIRADETSNLRSRVNQMESAGRTTQRY